MSAFVEAMMDYAKGYLDGQAQAKADLDAQAREVARLREQVESLDRAHTSLAGMNTDLRTRLAKVEREREEWEAVSRSSVEAIGRQIELTKQLDARATALAAELEGTYTTIRRLVAQIEDADRAALDQARGGAQG